MRNAASDPDPMASTAGTLAWAVAAPPSAIARRLRAETREEHAAIEVALGLTGADLSLARYLRRLEQFYGFYWPIEERLTSALGPLGEALDLPVRRKTPLLRADLAALGAAAEPPLCPYPPPLADPDAALGCLDVLEGATLGGQVICRHVRAALGVTPERGARFFHGYGESTGARWRAFQTALAAAAATAAAQDRIVGAAIATFRALRRWCAERDLL